MLNILSGSHLAWIYLSCVQESFCWSMSPCHLSELETDVSLKDLSRKQIACAASKQFETFITLKAICGGFVLVPLNRVLPFQKAHKGWGPQAGCRHVWIGYSLSATSENYKLINHQHFTSIIYMRHNTERQKWNCSRRVHQKHYPTTWKPQRELSGWSDLLWSALFVPPSQPGFI